MLINVCTLQIPLKPACFATIPTNSHRPFTRLCCTTALSTSANASVQKRRSKLTSGPRILYIGNYTTSLEVWRKTGHLRVNKNPVLYWFLKYFSVTSFLIQDKLQIILPALVLLITSTQLANYPAKACLWFAVCVTFAAYACKKICNDNNISFSSKELWSFTQVCIEKLQCRNLQQSRLHLVFLWQIANQPSKDRDKDVFYHHTN